MIRIRYTQTVVTESIWPSSQRRLTLVIIAIVTGFFNSSICQYIVFVSRHIITEFVTINFVIACPFVSLTPFSCRSSTVRLLSGSVDLFSSRILCGKEGYWAGVIDCYVMYADTGSLVVQAGRIKIHQFWQAFWFTRTKLCRSGFCAVRYGHTLISFQFV